MAVVACWCSAPRGGAKLCCNKGGGSAAVAGYLLSALLGAARGGAQSCMRQRGGGRVLVLRAARPLLLTKLLCPACLRVKVAQPQSA